jgi:putative ABC transport system permease protein
MSRRRWWRSAHWRRAPVVLVHHSSALVAVFVAGLLVALAATSAPFVTTAAASAALKDKLTDLSPFATGLVISDSTEVLSQQPDALLRAADRREAAVVRLANRLDLEPPVFTEEAGSPSYVSTRNGDTQVRLIARTGVLGHVRILARTGGPGVWVSDMTAREARLRPGGKLRVRAATSGNRAVTFRVKGIYRALDSYAVGAYWTNFLREIYPPGVDPPPPPRYVFLSRNELYRSANRLGAGRTITYQGRLIHLGPGLAVSIKAEAPVDPSGLTLAGARRLDRRFTLVRRALRSSSLARAFGCGVPPAGVRGSQGSSGSCAVSSSLSSAVVLADANASAISPVVTLLSGAGVLIALAVAGTAGVFLVRRRRAEAALLFARGEHVGTFAGRTAVEVLLPIAVGGAAGFAVAVGLTRVFAPSGSIDGGTMSSAAAYAAVAVTAGLVLVVGAAAIVFRRQFDVGTRYPAWVRWLPWELPVLAVALWLLRDVQSGGGLAASGTSTAHHPTLAVFLFPLLLVAAVAGLLARLFRFVLRPRPARDRGELPPAVFLALRRLSAARGVLVVLAVVSAVAFGAYFYSEALAASLTRAVTEKAYIARGGDAQGLVSDSVVLPRRSAYPLTKLQYGNQVATIGGSSGPQADVMTIDPASFGRVIRWFADWGPDPRGAFPELAASSTGGLPVILTSDAPSSVRAIWLEGVRIPVRVVSRVKTFPGMSVGIPLVVASGAALKQATRKAHVFTPLGEAQTYVWAKGPPGRVGRALEASPLQAYFVTNVDTFRKDPDVLLATRTFAYMRTIAIASGLLVLMGLLLYLQARQRSQAIASALARRMGLRRRTEILSLALELAAIALFAGLVGGAVAVSAAGPIVGHIDSLPEFPPSPALLIPVGAIIASAVALVVLAVAAGALTSWLASRTDISEALRVA